MAKSGFKRLLNWNFFVLEDMKQDKLKFGNNFFKLKVHKWPFLYMHSKIF